ncbi:MAG: glutathione S-transferase N-terminal domain-containing protein [Acetobacteraceae bacterium]|nr:glutathione S-transferase N-terminal domain-containing protein [Acetobacteraceae bacterium]MBV8522843.1 glutathione S-transferase N-terminal domain-containing protein [Acetobacteraceae bacterium]
MKLISATPSPYARKVRIALEEKGIAFELITEIPWNEDTTLPEYNPLEKLPVLIADDGTAVYESSYILEWLERKYPHPPLLPPDDDGILAAKRYQVLADGICDAVVLLFFERQRGEQSSAPWIARQMRKVEGGTAAIAQSLGDAEFAVRNQFGLADIAMGSALGYMRLRLPEFDFRNRCPNLAWYQDRLEERPSFKATVPSPQSIRDAVV